MAIAFIQEAFELIFHTYTAHRDALGAPSPAVTCSENFGCFEDSVQVIHWLSLPHEHNIGELVNLGEGVNLIQNVGDRQATFKSLFAGLAKKTIHFAAHLT